MAPTAILICVLVLFGNVSAGGWSEGQPGAPPAVPLNAAPQNNSTLLNQPQPIMSQIPPPSILPEMFHITPTITNTTAPKTAANTPDQTTENVENQGPLGAVIRIITTFVRATPLSYFASSPDNGQPNAINGIQNSTAAIPPVPTTTPAGPIPTGQPTPTTTAGSPTVPTQLLAPVNVPAQPPVAMSQTVGVTPAPPVATSAPATISPAAATTTTPVPPPAPQPQPMPASANTNFGLFNSGVLVMVLTTVLLW